MPEMSSPPSFGARVKRMLFKFGALPYSIMTRQTVWRTHCASLADDLSLEANARVSLLDLGCGPGISAFGLADRLPRARVVGLDLSEQMLRNALRYLRDEHGPASGVVFLAADAHRLPFPDASFDAATGHSFLYLVDDAPRLLRDVARVLRDGGRCAFLEPSTAPFPYRLLLRAFRHPLFVLSMVLWRQVSRSSGRFDEERFRALLSAAGLDPVAVRPTLSGLGWVGVARKRAATATPDAD